MKPPLLAYRSLTRQPARAILGVLGIAVVGALLFDMLLLSRGLVLSFEDLLDDMGFDVRVTATSAIPGTGPPLRNVAAVAEVVRSLPEIGDVVAVSFGEAEIVDPPAAGETASGETRRRTRRKIGFLGSSGSARSVWTLRRGSGLVEEVAGDLPAILINEALAGRYGLGPGDRIRLRGACSADSWALPPREVRIAGIVEYGFEVAGRGLAGTTLEFFRETCAIDRGDEADSLMVASLPEVGTSDALAAIDRALPGLYAFSNRQLVSRFEATDFSYFRQISFALATITLFCSFLLIATMLTVSVNQRLGEVAALRALGFSRGRVAADLLWESVLLVATGGLLALPLGAGMALWLDSILRSMPGLPAKLHFFVFEPRALLLYGVLLLLTGLLAAVYPIYLAARLPIAATLRKEIVS